MKSMKESLVEFLKKFLEDLCRRLLVEILTENPSGIFEAIPCRITEFLIELLKEFSEQSFKQFFFFF